MDDRDATEEAIMEATYRALSTHGYGDLTIQNIADEFDRSKSLLYYHYEGKDELLAAFLGYALDRFIADLDIQDEDPGEQLALLVDRLLPETIEDERYNAQVALMELRSHAPHVETFSTQFSALDEQFSEMVVTIIQDGVDSGQFQPVDPQQEADLLVSVLSGMRTRRFTTEGYSVETAKVHLEELLQDRLGGDLKLT